MSTDQFRNTMTTDPRNAEAARTLLLGLAGEALDASRLLTALYEALGRAETDGELVNPKLVGAGQGEDPVAVQAGEGAGNSLGGGGGGGVDGGAQLCGGHRVASFVVVACSGQ